jgi:cysteine-rich repeat protein
MRLRAVGIGSFLLATSVAPGCDKSDSVVVVKVSADAEVANVFQLRAQVSNAGEGVTRMFPEAPGAQAIVFETAFSLTVPRGRTGALDIALDGLDANGNAVANGAATVDLHGGDNLTVMITLQPGASPCGNGQIDSGEACDDRDRLTSGECDYLCQPRTSGPGVGGAGGSAGGASGGGGAGGRCTIELLTSGDFDGSNTRWMQVTNGRTLIYEDNAVPSFVPAPQTAPRLAWLGYDVKSAKPALRQTIMVPTNAVQVNISGYRQIHTDENACACDYARVQLDVGGTVTNLVEWSAYDANSDWAFFSTFVNATPIAGQTVTLQIQADMDDDVNTSFFFDSLSVTANVCP